MVIKRVGPMSCARIAGTLYAVVGLLVGCFVSLISVAGGFMGGGETQAFPQLFGVAAIVVFPVLYGVLGFVGTLIGAWLYNTLAGAVGGIEVDIQ